MAIREVESDREEKGMSQYNRGLAYYEREEWDKALEEFKKAAEDELVSYWVLPYWVKSCLSIGAIYCKQEKWVEALQNFDQAIKKCT